MRTLIILAAALAASPAMAASGPFFSLHNTNFVVLIAFLVFIGILVYFKVPGLLGGMLDKRAVEIKGELDEARQLREEAQSLLASYERKQKEVQDQADSIVANAKAEAEAAAVQAKDDLQKSIAAVCKLPKSRSHRPKHRRSAKSVTAQSLLLLARPATSLPSR